MNDAEIIQSIDQLMDEEHRLERDHADTGLSDGDKARLAEVEMQLDQCWDLLRQRRARRQAGQNPDDVHTRSTAVVEGYQQ